MNLRLNHNRVRILNNALLVAAEKYRANAAELRAYATQPLGGNALVTKEAALALADDFDRQELLTSELLEEILDAE